MNQLPRQDRPRLGCSPAGYTAAIYAVRANLSRANRRHGQGRPADDDDKKSTTGPPTCWACKAPSFCSAPRARRALRDQALVWPHRPGQLLQAPVRLKGDSCIYTCDALIICTGASTEHLGLTFEAAFEYQAA